MKKSMLYQLVAGLLLFCLVLLPACDAAGPAATLAGNETAFQTRQATGTATEPLSEETKTAEPVTNEPETVPETLDPDRDTTPPFFLTFTSSVTIDQGSEFKLHKYLSYIDDLDPEVELTVEGSVDTNTLGDYRLTLTLEDDAGNTASSNMTVQVAEPDPNRDQGSGSSTPAKSFSEFAETYQKDGAMVGIDVSKWQGNINFNKVASAGCEFVIMRIGGYADGVFRDKYYASNIKNAKAAGLKVGVYWYSEENGADQVRKNADYLYSLLDGEKLDFPIFFDWEDYRNIEDYKMSLRDLNEMFLAFREEAESRGYSAALYNSKYYLGILWNEEVKGDGVWLAHYTAKTSYEGKYFLWQQGFGRISGISGDVDVDVFYPDKAPWL